MQLTENLDVNSGVPSDDDLKRIRVAAQTATIAIQHDGALKAVDSTYQEIKQSEGELRGITDLIPQAIIVLRPDGRATYANKVALEYTGLSLNEVLADNFRSRVFHPDDAQRLREERAKALSGTIPFENEQRALGKDGEYRWFLIQYNPFLDDNGKVVHWYATGTDIHDRKRSEEELLREQYELRSKQEIIDLAQKAANAMAFDWYIQQDVNTWSPEQEALYGLPPGAFDGRYDSWKKLIHPDDWPEVVKTLKSAHENGIIATEFRVVWPDGSVHWLSANGQMLMDKEGQPYRMVGFTADATPRKLAEESLKRSEAFLAQAQRLSLTGSVGWSIPDGEMFWSDETFRIAGLDPKTRPSLEEILRRTHPEDRSRVKLLLTRAFEVASDLDFEHRLLLPDGSVKFVHVIGRPITYSSGKVELVGAVTDVTAARLAFDEIRKLRDQLHKENVVLREEIVRSSMFEEIVGSSGALRKVLTQVSRVAPTDSTVLIQGETGTGKELIARAIHKRSRRAKQPFIRVNCGAIPTSLVASELFGHEKGAFTGATQRRLGRFEAADGGTLFLDEVGELAADTQIALLRVLQEREFERVGGNRAIPVDVRVLAATNCDLETAVASGDFRSDLFYRLNVFPIRTPPLRERIDDIPLLLEYLIGRYAKLAGKNFKNIDKRTMKLFQDYDWPGNVRELQNIIERAVILSDGETFSVDETWFRRENRPSLESTHPLPLELEEREREVIEAALLEAHGRVGGSAGAAAKLGIPRQTLESKIKTLGIDKFRFKMS